MNFWDFEIRSPRDLPVFADLLADWGHPGEAIVRHLIVNKKFPCPVPASDHRFRDNVGNRIVCWYWCIGPSKLGFFLPGKAFYGVGKSYYYTATEAIWAVIQAGKYKPRKVKQDNISLVDKDVGGTTP